MKLKDIKIESLRKEKQPVRKFSTADEALNAKHDLTRAFFKNIILPK
jgi:hypothetical protein